MHWTTVVWQLEKLFLPLNERFGFLPLEGSMSRCLHLQISGFFFSYATQEFGIFIIKCCVILWGLMQDFVRKKQYFISFYIPFINPLHLRMFFFPFLFCSPAVLCCFLFRSPCVFFNVFIPPLFTSNCCGAFSLCAYNTSSSPPALVSARLCLSPFIRRVIFSHNSRWSHCVSPYLWVLSFRTKRDPFQCT